MGVTAEEVDSHGNVAIVVTNLTREGATLFRGSKGVFSGVEEDTSEQERRVRTEGLWLKCDKCTQIIWKKALDENFQCCPNCDFHFRISARERLELLYDGPFEEHDRDLTTTDPLGFVDAKSYRGAPRAACRKPPE